MSSSLSPTCCSTFGNRLYRPDAHDFRRHAGHRVTHETPERRKIEAFIAASLISTTAAAPSEVCELLPAVTLPFAANTGRSFARPSGDVSRRGPSSLVAVRCLTRNFARSEIGLALDDVVGRDLILEFAGVGRAQRAPVAFGGEHVLLLAR